MKHGKAVGLSKSGMGAAYDGSKLPEPRKVNADKHKMYSGPKPKSSGNQPGGAIKPKSGY